jgi:gamma-butyrobetaine dioxygenase
MSAIDDIMSLFQIKGSAPNGGEKVSQLEHALQCAHLAQSANAPPSMVAAALLHDIGHLLDDAPNAPHEHLGYSWVAEHFPETVSEPVRLHVAAKRYLCATDGGYHDQLSPASVQSLHIQGGPMTDTELDAFEEELFYPQAVQLRRWDDQSKAEKAAIPGLDAYRDTIARLMKTPAAKT